MSGVTLPIEDKRPNAGSIGTNYTDIQTINVLPLAPELIHFSPNAVSLYKNFGQIDKVICSKARGQSDTIFVYNVTFFIDITVSFAPG